MPLRQSLILTVACSGLLACASTALAQDDPQHVAPTDPLSPADQLKQFRLPPGFEIQLVAAEPDVRKPINMSFDARGRLLVTQSVEYPFAAKDPAKARDRVSVLSDFADNGRAAKVSVLIDGLNIPIGITPTADGAIVHSIPNLYRCRDKDGDGKIDSRDVLYREFGSGDTHGMVNSLTRWFDGWVYACHGFSNTSKVKGADGEAITMQSGNTFRFRDGRLAHRAVHARPGEPVRPGLRPAGQPLLDRLPLAAGLSTAPRRLLPQLRQAARRPGLRPRRSSRTSTARPASRASSTTRPTTSPRSICGTLFIGNPITHRINHDKLETRGSTYRAIEQPDFLISDDPWFRPVDLQLGPDGALYVADFYNRIIGHYEVPLTHPLRDRERGRIWRIVYRGADRKTTPPKMPEDITAATLTRLIELLGHPNLTVRRLATNVLVDRCQGSKADQVRKRLSAFLDNELDRATPEQRAFGLWAAERCGCLLKSRVAKLAADESPLVRVHMMKAFAARPVAGRRI